MLFLLDLIVMSDYDNFLKGLIYMLFPAKPDREHIAEFCAEYNPEIAAQGRYAVQDDILHFSDDLLVAAAFYDDGVLYYIDPDIPLHLAALYKYVQSLDKYSVALVDDYFSKLFQTLRTLAPDIPESVCNIIDTFICAANGLQCYGLQLLFVELRRELGFGCGLELLS